MMVFSHADNDMVGLPSRDARVHPERSTFSLPVFINSIHSAPESSSPSIMLPIHAISLMKIMSRGNGGAGGLSSFVIVHSTVSPMETSTSLQFALALFVFAYVVVYPSAATSTTVYVPASTGIGFVPSSSKPCAAPPFTVNANVEVALVPPLSLTRIFLTKSVPPMSSFVTVHVFVSPFAIVPEQSAENDC